LGPRWTDRRTALALVHNITLSRENTPARRDRRDRAAFAAREALRLIVQPPPTLAPPADLPDLILDEHEEYATWRARMMRAQGNCWFIDMSNADVTRLHDEAPHLFAACLTHLSLPTSALVSHSDGIDDLRRLLSSNLDALHTRRTWAARSKRTAELLARYGAAFALEVRASVKGGFEVVSYAGRAFLPRSRAGSAAPGDHIIGHLLKYNPGRDALVFGYTRHRRPTHDGQVSRWNPRASRPPEVYTDAWDIVRVTRDAPELFDVLERLLTDPRGDARLQERLARAWLGRDVPEVMRWARDADPDDLPETLRAVALAARGDVADVWAMAITRQNARLFEVVWRATDPDATWPRG
jgi:hypothetical protein